MKITIKLTGSLDRYVPDYRAFSDLVVDMKPGATTKDLVERLNIPASEAVVVTRGDKIVSQADPLRDNDVLTLVQAFQGG